MFAILGERVRGLQSGHRFLLLPFLGNYCWWVSIAFVNVFFLLPVFGNYSGSVTFVFVFILLPLLCRFCWLVFYVFVTMPTARFDSCPVSYLSEKHRPENKSSGYEGGVPRTPIGKLVSVSVSKDEFYHDEPVKTRCENNPSSNVHLGWHCLHWSSNLPPLHLLGGRGPG